MESMKRPVHTPTRPHIDKTSWTYLTSEKPVHVSTSIKTNGNRSKGAAPRCRLFHKNRLSGFGLGVENLVKSARPSPKMRYAIKSESKAAVGPVNGKKRRGRLECWPQSMHVAYERTFGGSCKANKKSSRCADKKKKDGRKKSWQGHPLECRN